MKTLLAATLVGLAIVALANPAAAYVVAVTTSIPARTLADDRNFEDALESAVDDVLPRGIPESALGETLHPSRRAPAPRRVRDLPPAGSGQDRGASGNRRVPEANGREPRARPGPRDDAGARARGAEQDGNVVYRYADPDTCRCVYVGGSKEYSAYQRLVTERQIAQRRIWAEDDARSWGFWGPWYWR